MRNRLRLLRAMLMTTLALLVLAAVGCVVVLRWMWCWKQAEKALKHRGGP